MWWKIASHASGEDNSGEVWKFLYVTGGHHVYASLWEPYPDDEFSTKHEKSNPHDKYAITVMQVHDKVAKVVRGKGSVSPAEGDP